MERSKHSSVLKNLALAVGDGLAFGMAMKLTQGPAASGKIAAVDAELRLVREASELRQAQMTQLEHTVQGFETRMAALAHELPPKIRQIVDALEASINARIVSELSAVEERHRAEVERLEARNRRLEEELKPEVPSIAFTQAEPVRKWRMPLVASLLVFAVTLAWLQFA